MQSASSRVWTHIAMFISYDDNHYTMGTSMNPTILLPAIGKIVGQAGLFNLGMATSLGEGKLWIQTC